MQKVGVVILVIVLLALLMTGTYALSWMSGHNGALNDVCVAAGYDGRMTVGGKDVCYTIEEGRGEFVAPLQLVEGEGK